jgi:hypothetical protein
MLFEVLTNLLTLIELDCDDDCVLLKASRSLAVIGVGVGLKHGAARRARDSRRASCRTSVDADTI